LNEPPFGSGEAKDTASNRRFALCSRRLICSLLRHNGARSLRKGILEALLEPTKLLEDAEKAGKNHERLALMEELKTFSFVAV
jgi:L-rhamnose isomerase